MLLTSHYMADVEALCKRVIVIHHGRILYDGELSGARRDVRRVQDDRRRARERRGDLSRYGEVIHRDGDWVTLRVPKAETSTSPRACSPTRRCST